MQQPPGPPFGGPPQGYQPTQWPQQQQQQPWPQQQPGYPGQGHWPGQQPPKKKGNGCLIACIIGGVVLASCGALVAIGAASKSSSKPGAVKVEGSLPASKKEYEGSWVGPGVSLRIQRDGTVNYTRKGGKSTSINGMKIDRFEHDDFVVDMILTDTTFKVSAPPTEKEGKWKMTVDGIELTRAGTADDAFDAASSVGCKPKDGGFLCVVTHTGGTTDLKTCWDLEIECRNGKKTTLAACEEVAIGGTKDHAFAESEVDPGKVCDLKDWNVKNIKLTVP